ncbi:membrane protein [Thalassospira sp. HJ]|uniref:Bax inhibitor-1/YccA family protein n=1 Tax=unclassified Thalassospira TaxID=2648997 RepID=UPI0005CEC483|nr:MULTISPECIES: Bax inhibitor-1/YccA family protein [unclassified Thalassospira]KJE34035.1 membrane protein [Thalassospira sp. HJ]MBC06849.1 BAX inhibitor (BI)-1/YccA family protein [Thalassospira sp.]
MAFETRQRGYDVSVGRSAAEIDEGLRAYMLRVYNYMASALALTGIVAMAVSTSPTLMQAIFGTGLHWIVMLAPIGLVFFLSARIHKMSFGAAQATFWVYAGLMGLSLASIFLVYTGESIARTFFITAGTFGAMSLFGYTTKKDLSGWGSFLFMGLIGIIIAMVVNIFLASTMLQFVISAAGVLIFTGLTAYDTQKIKEEYHEHDDATTAGKKALFGALRLYLDFVNLFIMLLHFFGNRE